jgi:peptidoglycan/xylan/chitin deacetylase (PgdA/CDA1 family)
LPAKAILLSFDDGYRSFYDRVYPLLLAYRYPAVLGLVTSWMDVPADGTVDYGGVPRPRSDFVSWDAVRQMQASGLVEIASHSHDLHRVVVSTPQGNTGPAARSWAVNTATGQREDDAAHHARIAADLTRSADRIAAETGVRPRVIVWPFGRYSGLAAGAARAAGFDHALTLEPELADARLPMALHRYYPTQDPSLGIKAWNLDFAPRRAETVRLACLDLASLAGQTPDEADRRLGDMVEHVRALGATAVVVDLVDRQEPLRAWLPNPVVPMADDVFGRAARQIGSRAGVQVIARLPVEKAEQLGDAALAQLAAAAARVAPLDGLLIADPAHAAAPPATAPDPGAVRATRAASPNRAAQLFAPAAALDSRLRLITAGAWGPAADSDRRIVAAGPAAAGLAAAGWLAPAASGRTVIPLPDGDAATMAKALNAAQRLGATAFLACPFDAGTLAGLAPAFSAATFPHRP